jgi:AraC family transcriptional regulator of adaptative response/methylated-DNA-[protein]-cysteine methyltransferase
MAVSVKAASLATEVDPRWAKIIARDRSVDGQFWFSVFTTGVYCRPGCPARTPNPENVTIHDSLADAKATGFRACKRCNPDGRDRDGQRVALVARACKLIEESVQTPSLNDMSASMGLSPGYFHRIFKASTGLTPKAYATAHLARRVRSELAGGNSVTDTIYNAGFNSSSRFYEKSIGMLGMTPRRYRDGGARETIRFSVGSSSLGSILVASSEKGVAAIFLGDGSEKLVRDLQLRFPKAELIGADEQYQQLVARVVELVEAPGLGLDLPLDIRGTAFQQRVWKALQDIPAGTTATYAELATRIGSPSLTRAVAAACAANNIAIAIPCHRIIRQGGALAGYRWGVERKRALIDREAAEGE